MVEIDRRWDTIKAFQKAGSKPLSDAAHDALQLAEHLRESGRGADISTRPIGFHKMLADGEAGAAALHKALSATPVDATGVETAFKRVAASCVSCHKSYRD